MYRTEQCLADARMVMNCCLVVAVYVLIRLLIMSVSLSTLK